MDFTGQYLTKTSHTIFYRIWCWLIAIKCCESKQKLRFIFISTNRSDPFTEQCCVFKHTHLIELHNSELQTKDRQKMNKLFLWTYFLLIHAAKNKNHSEKRWLYFVAWKDLLCIVVCFLFFVISESDAIYNLILFI